MCCGHQAQTPTARRIPRGDTEESAAASSSQNPQARPRGGIRQRLASHPGATPADADDLPLLEGLKRDWAKGKINSAKVLEYSQRAIRQGATDPGKMADLGAENAFRSLKSLFGWPEGAPTLRWIELPMVGGKKVPHPFLLPHEFFSAYFQHRKKDWVATMCGPRGACAEYWSGLRDSLFIQRHPTLTEANWHNAIPIGLHGDAGAFSHSDSLYTISWNSLVGRGETAKKRFLLTVLRKSDMVKGETLDAIFRIFSWSVNAMLEGAWPAQNWFGRSQANGGEHLAGGWAAALCQVRGDWAFYTEVFQFPQWNSADRMCWLCRASSTVRDRAWTNSRPGAGWRRTRWTHEGYIEYLRAAGMAVPVLLLCIVGFRLECVMVDTLHAVDQGVSSHVIANTMWHFAVNRRVFGGATQEAAVAALHQHMNRWYRNLLSSSSPSSSTASKVQGKLSIERLRTKNSWPKLKAKAAATRHLAGYALFLCQTFGSPEDRAILAVCQLLVEFYKLLNDEPPYL